MTFASGGSARSGAAGRIERGQILRRQVQPDRTEQVFDLRDAGGAGDRCGNSGLRGDPRQRCR